MAPVGRFLDFIGGAIGRMVVAGLLFGIFAFLVGMTLPEFVAYVLEYPPKWIDNPWFRLGCIIIGLAAIWGSLSYNLWSRKQQDQLDTAKAAIAVLFHHASRGAFSLLICQPRSVTN